MPTVLRQFKALKSFESEETRSAYVEGLTYRVFEGNAKLDMMVDLWVKQGKVAVHSIGPRIVGSGEVS